MKLTEAPSGRGYLGTTPNMDISTLTTPFAFLGVRYGPPYVPTDLIEASTAPDVLRALTSSSTPEYDWSRYDFDWGRTLFPSGVPTVTDVGNVIGDVRDIELVKRRVTEAVSQILERGSVPIVQGGLDSIPPLVVAAYEQKPVSVLQLDAHLDYRDEIDGIRDGYSSPMRRIREMPWVKHIVQVGLRGRGSAGDAEIQKALSDGNTIVTSAELRRRGVQDVIASLPSDEHWIITMDCDGLDPSIAPGVYAKAPGGISFDDASELISHFARNKKVAGFITAEYMPEFDVGNITGLVVARLQETVIALQGGS